MQVTPATPPNKQPVHPAIVASLSCLGVLAALLVAQIVLIRHQPALAVLPVFAAVPFDIAALLCAIHGMCHGNIKPGLLLLGGLGIIFGWSCGIQFGAILAATTSQNPQLDQLQQLQKQFEQMLQQ